MSNLGSNITQGFNSIFGFLTDGLKSILDSIFSGITGIWNILKSLGSILNGAFEWFYNSFLKATFEFILSIPSAILNGFKVVIDFFVGIWEWFINLFKFLFIPSGDFITPQFNNINSTINSKLGIDVSTLESLKNTTANINDLTFTIQILGRKFSMDLNVIKNYAYYSRAIFGGLTGIFLIWYHIRNALKLFNANIETGSHVSQSQNPNAGGTV